MDTERRNPIITALIAIAFSALLLVYLAAAVLLFPLALYVWTARRPVALPLGLIALQMIYVPRGRQTYSFHGHNSSWAHVRAEGLLHHPLDPDRWVDVGSLAYPLLPVELRVWRHRREEEQPPEDSQGGWVPAGSPEGPRRGSAPATFEKFSERARRVLSLAQEEAQHFNHNYIGPEHILLGLVRETDGVAARVLSSLGVELPKVRSAVEFIIGRGGRPSPGDVGLTPRAKTVIELAVAEARGLGHGYIGAIDDLAWKTRDPRRFYLLGTRELHTGDSAVWPGHS